MAAGALLALLACAPAPDHTGNAGAYVVTLRADPNPASLGDTHLTVGVTGAEGKRVTDATVMVRMFMPGMPMSTDDNPLPGVHLGKGRYRAAGDFSMGGDWGVEVTVAPKDGEPVSVTFPYTVEWKLD